MACWEPSNLLGKCFGEEPSNKEICRRKLQRRKQSPGLQREEVLHKTISLNQKNTNSNNSKKSYWSYGGGKTNTWECGDPRENVEGTSSLGWPSAVHQIRAQHPVNQAGILEVKCWAGVPPSRSKQLEINFSIKMYHSKEVKTSIFLSLHVDLPTAFSFGLC